MLRSVTFISFAFFVLLTSTSSYAAFDYSKSSIPTDEIISGGPGKDGIPALTHPRLVTAEEATFLNEDDLVLGVRIKDEARAYPIKILNWHEAVNDTVADTPILATW